MAKNLLPLSHLVRTRVQTEKSTGAAGGRPTPPPPSPPTVDTPTFEPPAGAYVGTQNVAISCSTPGASIYYTTDGSTPTVLSTPYAAPVAVAASETIKAMAAKLGYFDSAVASAHYDISYPPVTWDPAQRTTTPPGIVLSGGDLACSTTDGGAINSPSVRSTLAFATGKRFYVTRVDADPWFGTNHGGITAGFALASWLPGTNDPAVGIGYGLDSWGMTDEGQNPPIWDVVLPLVPVGDYMLFAADIDLGRIWIGACVAGVVTWVGDPAAGTGPAFTFPPGSLLYAGATLYGDGIQLGQETANFGASAFPCPAPTGFLAWDGSVPSWIKWDIAHSGGGITLSDGGTTASANADNVQTNIRATVAHSTGRRMVEFLFTGVGVAGAMGVGVCEANFDPAPPHWGGEGTDSFGSFCNLSLFGPNGAEVNTGVDTGMFNDSEGTPANVGLAVDFDAGKGWLCSATSGFGTGDPETGANPHFTFAPNTLYYPLLTVFMAADRVTIYAAPTLAAMRALTTYSNWS